MSKPGYSPEEDAWLRENYPLHGPRQALKDAHDRDWPEGPVRTMRALIARAHVLRLYVARPMGRTGRQRCERIVRWSKEPEMSAWMAEHDHGNMRTYALSEAFRGEFGFGITRQQISAYRTLHGTQTKRGQTTAQDWHRKPVGYERDTGKGYVLVKVAENPDKPGTKDNWRPKHFLAWEAANGRPVPDGYMVMMGDKDYTNLDPSNLVLVEKRLIGPINGGAFGEYHDAETLKAVAACAKLKGKLIDVELRPRKCWHCGREFTPSYREGVNVKTCPECVKAGHKATGLERHGGRGTCEICGAEYEKYRRDQRRCPECIARHPGMRVDQQLRKEGKRA